MLLGSARQSDNAAGSNAPGLVIVIRDSGSVHAKQVFGSEHRNQRSALVARCFFPLCVFAYVMVLEHMKQSTCASLCQCEAEC
jgi:hypothetical protein